MSDAPSTVVFDLGGVLVDWDPRYLYRQLLPGEAEVEWFLAEVATPAWNLEQDRGRSWTEAVEGLTAEFPEHAELIAAYRDRWPETIGGQFDATVAILTELRAAGRPLFALTNWSAETFPVARRRFEWLDWFDGIVVSGEERLVKPDPAIYRVLVTRYGIDPGSAVFIDDNAANAAAATTAGMGGIHFTGPDELRSNLLDAGLLPR